MKQKYLHNLSIEPVELSRYSDVRGSIYNKGQEFSLHHSVQAGSGTHKILLCSGHQRLFPPGGKASGCDHSAPSSAGDTQLPYTPS
jgi:hypothetical protein